MLRNVTERLERLVAIQSLKTLMVYLLGCLPPGGCHTGALVRALGRHGKLVPLRNADLCSTALRLIRPKSEQPKRLTPKSRSVQLNAKKKRKHCKTPFIDELTKLYGIPPEATLGGAETMYPEFRKKIKDKFVMPAKCTLNCGGPTRPAQ